MWIRYNYPVDVPSTPVMDNLIKEAEELDAKQDIEYFAVADAIDVLCKRYRTNEFYSQDDWDKMCYRYPGEEVL